MTGGGTTVGRADAGAGTVGRADAGAGTVGRADAGDGRSQDEAAVTVIGIDAAASAPDAARRALARARLVVGAARHLAALAPDPATERVVLGPLEPALHRLHAACDAGHPAVVLAGGDPGLFGIVRKLREAGLTPRVLPAVSSVAAAFARAGLPWDGAAVVTAHGRDLRPALNACRALPAVAVLTEPAAGAAELGAGLAGWPRRLIVAEMLGTDEERVSEVTPRDAAQRVWADPHVVLVLREGAVRTGDEGRQPAGGRAPGRVGAPGERLRPPRLDDHQG